MSLNPRTTSFEFLGPPGSALITVLVPVVAQGLYFICSEHAGGCPPRLPLKVLTETAAQALTSKEWWASLWDTQATLIYLAWFAFCVISWVVLPGDWVEGVTMRNGEKKKYKINGTIQPSRRMPSNAFAVQRSRRSSSRWALSVGSSRVMVLNLSRSSTIVGSDS
jgi:hypothetical protein